MVGALTEITVQHCDVNHVSLISISWFFGYAFSVNREIKFLLNEKKGYMIYIGTHLKPYLGL